MHSLNFDRIGFAAYHSERLNFFMMKDIRFKQLLWVPFNK